MRAFIGAVTLLCLVGCGPQGSAPQTDSGHSTSQTTSRERESEIPGRVVVAPSSPSNSGRVSEDAHKARFLNSIREADPNFQTIQRAIMNEENELGIILGRSVAMDDIPKLMKSLLTRMASEFPGEDLTIVAYAPSEPPMKIGTGRLNARTRDLTYTPARR